VPIDPVGQDVAMPDGRRAACRGRPTLDEARRDTVLRPIVLITLLAALYLAVQLAALMAVGSAWMLQP
jgi:hypothetical protein